ncbi:TPA: hypothetical protein ACGFBC_002637 [Clostridium perfringens]|uniref:hypothetical protein n=1 Tax=Clostridium perfringens TaxID=1502 RepID=UPI0024BC07F4|nr:hypothetical protein [Clostridium perfringens]
MKKLVNSSDLENISLPVGIDNKIKEILFILDEEYGKNREWDSLGGYVFLAESKEDIRVFKETVLNGILPEYTDEIICSEGVNYTSSLFLLSSDFSVVVIADEELSKILLE